MLTTKANNSKLLLCAVVLLHVCVLSRRRVSITKMTNPEGELCSCTESELVNIASVQQIVGNIDIMPTLSRRP